MIRKIQIILAVLVLLAAGLACNLPKSVSPTSTTSPGQSASQSTQSQANANVDFSKVKLEQADLPQGFSQISETELGFLGATASAYIQQQTKGHYPAPLAALELILLIAGILRGPGTGRRVDVAGQVIEVEHGEFAGAGRAMSVCVKTHDIELFPDDALDGVDPLHFAPGLRDRATRVAAIA